MLTTTFTSSKKMQPNHEDKQRRNLITVDRKYSLMNKEVKKQVETHLENELDYLLGRKELDLMRKRKVQEVQDAFEKQRISRILKMDEKISRSDKNRATTLREKQNRSKRNLQFLDQKIRKNANIKEKQLQKMLEAQQEYNKRNTVSRTSSKSLNRSNSNLKNSRSFNQNLLKTQLQKSLDSIDSRIQLIQSRIDQAKTNQQFYHRQKSEKAKSFYKDVNETLSKIHADTSRQETKCIQQYYNRANHIIDCQQRSKSFYEKQSQRRKRNIDERFRKCNQNLKYLNNERQSKMQKLSAKLGNSMFAPKSWRNEKEGVYLEKFMINQRKIQLQHSLKADSIINKHFNTGLKNKALRQKKDNIFQTVRGEIV